MPEWVARLIDRFFARERVLREVRRRQRCAGCEEPFDFGRRVMIVQPERSYCSHDCVEDHFDRMAW